MEVMQKCIEVAEPSEKMALSAALDIMMSMPEERREHLFAFVNQLFERKLLAGVTLTGVEMDSPEFDEEMRKFNELMWIAQSAIKLQSQFLHSDNNDQPEQLSEDEVNVLRRTLGVNQQSHLNTHTVVSDADAEAEKEASTRCCAMGDGACCTTPLTRMSQMMSVQINLESCVCARSHLHHRGVFAIKPIRQHEIITIYPTDVLTDQASYNMGSEQPVQYSQRFLECVAELSKKCASDPNSEYKFMLRDVMRSMAHYEAKIDDRISVFGCPLFHHHPTYLGHMCNDAAKLSTDDIRAKRLYAKIALLRCNAGLVYRNHILFVVATRDIDEGDEILIPYGIDYWLSVYPPPQSSLPVATAVSAAATAVQTDRPAMANMTVNVKAENDEASTTSKGKKRNKKKKRAAYEFAGRRNQDSWQSLAFC